jgi:sarcosine oxidase subunit delta
MLEIRCPWCGPRTSSEFAYAGEPTTRPAVGSTSIEEWRSYLYEQANLPTWTDERWVHSAGCGDTIALRRHLVTNEISYAADGNQVDA